MNWATQQTTSSQAKPSPARPRPQERPATSGLGAAPTLTIACPTAVGAPNGC
jgi:hypothetical protein